MSTDFSKLYSQPDEGDSEDNERGFDGDGSGFVRAFAGHYKWLIMFDRVAHRNYTTVKEVMKWPIVEVLNLELFYREKEKVSRIQNGLRG